MGEPVVIVADAAIPEEILHASGLATVRLAHADDAEQQPGMGWFPSQSCGFCRNVERLAPQAHRRFAGIVVASTCTAMEKLYEVFQRRSALDFVHMLDVPKVDNGLSQQAFRGRLAEFAAAVEGWLGRKISETQLAEAIRLNNRLRRALAEANTCRSIALGATPLSLATLPTAIATVKRLKRPQTNGAPRVLVFGSRLREDVIAKAIDNEGGRADAWLTDDGLRYNRICVEEDSPDPVLALARGYLGGNTFKRSIAGMPDIEGIGRLVAEQGIAGIVSLSYPFCAKSGYDNAWLRKCRDRIGVPLLFHQIDSPESAAAGLRNRLGAFVEMLDARGGVRLP